MILVYLGIALGVTIIINEVARRVADRIRAWFTRPLTRTDVYCSRADARLDELAARRATRPTGSCRVINGPWGRDAS